jgi:hypothetical protein
MIRWTRIRCGKPVCSPFNLPFKRYIRHDNRLRISRLRLVGLVITASYVDPHKNRHEDPRGPSCGLCHPDGPRFRV